MKRTAIDSPTAERALKARGDKSQYLFERGEVRLAVSHLAQYRAHALLRKSGLSVFAASLPLQALDRRQKPRCFWLAI
jgi:hypothetical protein